MVLGVAARGIEEDGLRSVLFSFQTRMARRPIGPRS